MSSPNNAQSKRGLIVILVAGLAVSGALYTVYCWWAEREAELMLREWLKTPNPDFVARPQVLREYVREWNNIPWYGEWEPVYAAWTPKSSYSKLMQLITGERFASMEEWGEWLSNHPDLVWDENIRQLRPAHPVTTHPNPTPP